MRAEFETLEHGRLGWALGCLGASMGWRLRANWLFLLAFGGVACFSDLIAWELGNGIDLLVSSPTFYVIFYAISWGALAAESGLFAAIRPRSWVSIGIGMALAQVSAGLFGFIFYFHMPFSFIPHIHLMDAQIDVGIGMYLGYSLVGALLGRTLGQACRRALVNPRVIV